MPRLSKIGAACLAAFGWTTGSSTTVSASYLVVAGGGGGGLGGSQGGGGGAGGLLSGTSTLDTTQSYTILVGAGGAGGTGAGTGSNGTSSVFNAISTTGGGGGGSGPTSGVTSSNGAAGGSGGGGSANANTTGGAGTSGQGNNGGNGVNTGGGGGGGGAGAVGSNGSGASGGNGGIGSTSSISGTSTYYAGGGGGGAYTGSFGTGGSGGGGNGGKDTAQGGPAPTPGTANTGGGGGGGAQTNGQAGGSGVVIISYSGAQKFSGGIVTSVGGNTIHTFTTSGTLGPITALSATYLVVAGGGSGGANHGGGGGAGGYRTGTATIDPNTTYLVTVGAGGAASATSGGNSAFLATTSAGGGYGSTGGDTVSPPAGGSGGGGNGFSNLVGGAGNTPSTSPSQGNNGGTGVFYTNTTGAGGGGASAVGANSGDNVAGAGGAGTANSISGTSTYYAGGGGGGTRFTGTVGAGGLGGGGAGAQNGSAGTAGTANTGGGGGGGGGSGGAGGNGGSGVVIISYPGSTQQMAGGTVTIVGGNVIHTFTSTGYLSPIKYSTGSLRFRQSGNNAYLSRTPTVAGNRQTWTWSGWVKRGILTTENEVFGSRPSAGTYTQFSFRNSGSSAPYCFLIEDNTYGNMLVTTQVFRDTAAWYHIVVVLDTTQATSSNRLKLYVNGVQVTSFSTTNYPAQNASLQINNTAIHNIAADNYDSVNRFDGEMTEINFVDGQALAPTSFGTFNSYGVWQPITYGGSYGTNGFYLPFNRQALSYAGSFNGSSQYLTPSSSTLFDLTSTSQTFTLEAFVFPSTINSSGPQNYRFTSILSKGIVYVSFGFTSTGVLRWYTYNGSENYINSNPGVVVAGKWNHLAIVSNAGAITLYANGVAVATGSLILPSGGGNGTAPRIGAADTSFSSDFFNGNMSNLRITNTAVYTSNFIPPTSALTAISGTQFLTLQNSSIVDNSTNAYSITNTGGVATGQTYPFAWGIFNDQGPAGNNWTPVNISGVFGTTLDYLGDAPTLTSSSVSNYAVLNPLTPVSQTITDGNLALATSTGNASSSTYFPSTGKWYWEVYINAIGGGNTASLRVGVCNTTGANAQDLGGSAYGWCFLGDGRVYYNGSTSSYGVSVTAGDTMMVALDLDAGKIWYGKNGTWMSSGNPATGANASQTFTANQNMSPALASGLGTPSYKINFGQQPFLYTPPSGFVQINAYNL